MHLLSRLVYPSFYRYPFFKRGFLCFSFHFLISVNQLEWCQIEWIISCVRPQITAARCTLSASAPLSQGNSAASLPPDWRWHDGSWACRTWRCCGVIVCPAGYLGHDYLWSTHNNPCQTPLSPIALWLHQTKGRRCLRHRAHAPAN